MKIKQTFPAFFAFFLLTGCLPPMGPSNLRRDHIAYDIAIQKGLQEELLLNIIQIRYGDAPIFLETQQIIASYAYQKNLEGVIAGTPWGGTSPSTNGLGLRGATNFSDNPTVTYQPLNGNEISAMVLAPLSPSVILPLIESGTPIDTLLSLTTASLGDAENISNPLSSGDYGTKISKDFIDLTQSLRKIQIANALVLRRMPGKSSKKKDEPAPERTFFIFKDTGNPEILKTEAHIFKLLHLSPKTKQAEIIYGNAPSKKGQINIVTRSMLSIFNNIAATIEVPDKYVERGITSKTITDNPNKGRSIILVHCGKSAPADSFVHIHHQHFDYWISQEDLSSKVAFSLLQLIDELAVNRSGRGAVVTIPVNG